MTVLEYLERHLPTDKAKNILSYLEKADCTLRITRKRKTKLGDFRHNGRQASISVNHDTNTYRFLFTLVHEIAHLKTYLEHKNSVKPHGTEWKHNFQELFTVLKVDEEFRKDAEIFEVVALELLDPKACSGVNVVLEKAFAKYEEQSGVYLDELSVGQTFVYNNVVYKKLGNRRTRVECLNLSYNKKYTIHKTALVEETEVKGASVEKYLAEPDDRSGLYLEDVPMGKTFVFRNQVYKKLETRRTRVVCLNLVENKKYTIPKAAPVEEADAEKSFAKEDKYSVMRLDKLPSGAKFIFRDQVYKKLETRRTRVVCLKLSDNLQYTIPKVALVEEA